VLETWNYSSAESYHEVVGGLTPQEYDKNSLFDTFFQTGTSLQNSGWFPIQVTGGTANEDIWGRNDRVVDVKAPLSA